MLKRCCALTVLTVLTHSAGAVRIEVVSALDPRWVTGDSVLLRVSPPSAITNATLDGHTIAPPLVPDIAGLALLSGLTPGIHRLTIEVLHRGVRPLRVTPLRVTPAAQNETRTLVFVSYPDSGPVISGPHETPFFCQTRAFVTGPGTEPVDLGEPDALCRVPTRIEHYQRTDSTFVNAASNSTMGTGYLLRVEIGVLNRSVYQIAIPVPDASATVDAFHPSAAWNGRLVYKFGGGCRSGWYRQGAATAGVFEHEMLRRGYAVVSASLNVFGNNCNDLLAAETAMIVKEHFIEHYGVPLFTIGWGCSGGSYQAHQIADNYPRVLDGIVVGCSFPEVGLATAAKLMDTRLLKRYFDWAHRETDVKWNEAQQLAVSGFGTFAAIAELDKGAARLDPVARTDRVSGEFDPVVPESARYAPTARPNGARATLMDHTVNVLGRDSEGRALWPLDNRGIQYGLTALRNADIDVAHFVHLNRHIGGLDRDASFVPERTRHDAAATRRAYASGRILSGAGGLAATPIIDYRAYADLAVNGDIHMKYHSFATRDRLVHANGHADNHVMWLEDALCTGCSLWSLESPVLQAALDRMGDWLSALTADQRVVPRARKVVDTKPADLDDACWIDGTRIDEPQRPFEGACNKRFPMFTSPRIVAGGPLASNVVACQLRAIDTSDYPVPLTAPQRAELDLAFPNGVCDWSKPSEEQTPAFQGLSFGPAPDARTESLFP